MIQTIFLVIFFIFLIFISRIIINKAKKAANIKAGKKWEGIVKELSERK